MYFLLLMLVSEMAVLHLSRVCWFDKNSAGFGTKFSPDWPRASPEITISSNHHAHRINVGGGCGDVIEVSIGDCVYIWGTFNSGI